MSPQMIHGNFVYESDMWSISVILFLMITGNQLFRARDKIRIFEKTLNAKFDIDLIKKILVKIIKKETLLKVFHYINGLLYLKIILITFKLLIKYS